MRLLQNKIACTWKFSRRSHNSGEFENFSFYTFPKTKVWKTNTRREYFQLLLWADNSNFYSKNLTLQWCLVLYSLQNLCRNFHIWYLILRIAQLKVKELEKGCVSTPQPGNRVITLRWLSCRHFNLMSTIKRSCYFWVYHISPDGAQTEFRIPLYTTRSKKFFVVYLKFTSN